MNKVYDVAVVGCGPAGISAIIESQARNLSVIALEKGDLHNMSIRKFYKEGKRVDKDYKGQVVQLEGYESVIVSSVCACVILDKHYPRTDLKREIFVGRIG